MAEIPRVLEALGDIQRLLGHRLREHLTTPAAAPEPVAQPAEDELLSAAELAQLLHVEIRWVYRHAAEWSFTRRLGRRTLRFSRRGLQRWMSARAA